MKKLYMTTKDVEPTGFVPPNLGAKKEKKSLNLRYSLVNVMIFYHISVTTMSQMLLNV